MPVLGSVALPFTCASPIGLPSLPVSAPAATNVPAVSVGRLAGTGACGVTSFDSSLSTLVM